MVGLKKITFVLFVLKYFLLVPAESFIRPEVDHEIIKQPNAYYEGNQRIVYENDTVTFEIRFYHLPSEVDVDWDIQVEEGAKRPYMSQKDYKLDWGSVCASLTTRMTKDVREVTCELTYRSSNRTWYYTMPYLLRKPTPPRIEAIGRVQVVNGFNYIEKNQKVSLLCQGDGIESFNITWLDSHGLPLQSSNAIQIGSLTKNKPSGHQVSGTRRLKFTAERGSTAFGCQLTKKYLGYPMVEWFNFSAPLTAKVIAKTAAGSKDVCGEVSSKFTCQTNAERPEELDYQWILNGNIPWIGGQDLVINSTDMELEHVYCSVSDGVESAYSEMEIEKLNCSVDWLMILSIIVVTTTFFLVAIYFTVRYYKLAKPVMRRDKCFSRRPIDTLPLTLTRH